MKKLDRKLFDAVRASDIEGVTRAIDEKANLQARDKFGETPLHCASDIEIMRLLVANEAVVDARNNAGETALLIAVVNGDPKLVRALLESGADPQASDDSRNTPSSYAKGWRNVGIEFDRIVADVAAQHEKERMTGRVIKEELPNRKEEQAP
jgi:hypothetical protein